MEAIDKNNYIIIGKYYISKTIMMTFPPQLSVFDSETNIINNLFDSKVFELLRNERLDAEPLHEYFDQLNGTTKEQRLEWQKQEDK